MESLTIKDPKTTHDTIYTLLDGIKSCELQTLNLTQVKFFHIAELSEMLVECIKSLTDLKKLNISNNDLNPNLLARIVMKLAKDEKKRSSLLSLDLSHN